MTAPAALVGRYEIGPLLGEGGMAEVYAARDTVLDRPVAVKIMKEDLVGRADVRRRLANEAALAARISHPHVVAVHDSGRFGELPYVVMERLPGPTLRDRLAAGPLPLEEVRTVATQLLAALGAAHEAGIVHRDVKPGNVLAAGDGSWKLADFGIAKEMEPAADETVTGVLVGTPAYLAPERFAGHPATAAADIFALGVVLYEALTGVKPSAPVEPVRDLRPGVDGPLADLVETCLATHPDDRWASAGAAATVVAAPHLPYGPPLEPGADRSPRRRPVLIGAATAAVALTALLVAATWSPSHPVPARVSPPAPATTTVPTTALTPAPPPPSPGKGHGQGQGQGQGGDGGD